MDQKETNQYTIVAKNVSKWYREIRGVSGISLTIGSGIMGLVGPNGAGKTTLLNLIAGLLIPSQGDMLVLGEHAFTGKAFRRLLGVVSQKEAVYPHMTVEEFVTTMTQLHGFSTAESKERAKDAIAKVQLIHKSQQKIHSLSKGMRQCLKLAQAIAHTPKILLLDELFTGCDPLVKHQIKTLLLDMAKNDATIVLSSHNLKEMESLTEQVTIIYCGKVVACGRIRDLQNDLRHKEQRICFTGENLRELGHIFWQYDDVTSVEFLEQEKSLFVQTKDSPTFLQRLPGILATGTYKINKMISQDQDLQALFRTLVQEPSLS